MFISFLGSKNGNWCQTCQVYIGIWTFTGILKAITIHIS